MQMLILTSEKVSHPSPSKFPGRELQTEGSCAKNAFSLYFLKLEAQKVEITQEQNLILGASI